MTNRKQLHGLRQVIVELIVEIVGLGIKQVLHSRSISDHFRPDAPS